MKLKAVSGIMFTLLMTSMLTFALNIQPVKASGTIYIRVDGSIDPPTAPISTLDNVTYTLTGNVSTDYHGIVIERNNIVLDGNGHTIEGCDEHGGIVVRDQHNVTIEEVSVKKFSTSILLRDTFNNTILNNYIGSSSYGVKLERSSDNIISGNNIAGVIGYSLGLYGSNSNVVSKNDIIDGNRGITFELCYYNVVSQNNITNSYIYGVKLRRCLNNSILENNIKTSSSHMYGTGISLSWSSSNNTIFQNSIEGYVYGVRLDREGSWIFAGSNTIISKNHITNNRLAVVLHYTNSNRVFENNMQNNGDGFNMVNSSFNTVYMNNITGNSGGGGSVTRFCYHNVVFQNNIENNNGIGLILYGSNNTFFENDIINNTRGMSLGGLYSPSLPTNNTVYHNNFNNNTEQVHIENALGNKWDNGYPSGGNYWSNHNGTDFYGGPYQNETDSDGIGDTPYVIDENNQDNYPLMNPYVPYIPNTPVGTNVTFVDSTTGVVMIFDEVTGAGETSVATSGTGPPPPSGFRLIPSAPPIYYEVTTTASYTGTIEIGIPYDENQVKGKEENLKLMHWNETEQKHVDVATWVDTENNVIYGRVSSLSPFTVMELLPSPPAVGGKATPIDKVAVKTELQTPWIWLTTIILSLAATTVFVRLKKKKQ